MPAVRPEPAAATNDAPTHVRGAYGSAPDLVMHSMLGIGGLFEEMASYGTSRAALIANTGIELAALDDAAARMTHRQKILLFRNVQRLSANPGVGLFAGQRQRLSDFGVFGYALASSATRLGQLERQAARAVVVLTAREAAAQQDLERWEARLATTQANLRAQRARLHNAHPRSPRQDSRRASRCARSVKANVEDTSGEAALATP